MKRTQVAWFISFFNLSSKLIWGLELSTNVLFSSANCSLIFSTRAWGLAPSTLSTTAPFLNKRTVGTADTPCFSDIAGTSSAVIFAHFAVLYSFDFVISSRTSFICAHWAAHGAWKCTTAKSLLLWTNSIKVSYYCAILFFSFPLCLGQARHFINKQFQIVLGA